MGRLATYIAGRASSADKLPGKLPNVSLIDALLPKFVSGDSPSRKSLGDKAKEKSKGQDEERGSDRGLNTHSIVKKNRKGQLVMVQHRDKSAGGSSGAGKATLQDVKKASSQDGKADQKQIDKVNNEYGFTPEEDEIINKLKAGDMHWADIAKVVGKTKDQVMQRHRDLKKQADKAPSDDAKGGTKQDNSKNTGGVAVTPGAEQWTTEEDNLIKKLSEEGLNAQKIAAQLPKRTKKQVGARIGVLRPRGNDNDNDNEGGGGNGGEKKGDGGNQHKNNQHAKGGDAKVKEGEWTAAEDEKIREGTAKKKFNAKEIAEALGKPVAEVGKRRSELQAADAEAKKNEGANKEKTNPKEQKKKDKKEAQQQAKQETPSEPKSSVSKAISSRSEAKFTMGEWMTLQEDDMFSFRELQLLSELITQDAEDSRDGAYSWLRVASLFADRTDRRVHPEDIREKFEAMARD